MTELFRELHDIILLKGTDEKCHATHALAHNFKSFEQNHANHAAEIPLPGLPPQLELVPPRKLKRRSIASQQGRTILLHSIAHIEFNAINLALDAAYRFRDQPQQFYADWIAIAADEARHFCLIREYLNNHDCDYGDFPAHNGLWEMAVATSHDVVARMALIPRVLEARGLDVTPGMIKRLNGVGDSAAVAILEVIYQDEIGHVERGSHWYFHHCALRELDPTATFVKLVEEHLNGELRGPFNLEARLLAGFDSAEMTQLSSRY